MTFRRLPREWGFTLVANALIGVDAAAQTALPDITIHPKKTAFTKPQAARAAPVAKPHSSGLVHAASAPKPSPTPVAQAAPTPPPAASPTLDHKMKELDAARDALLPKTGASVYTIGRETIENLPQGDNTPIDKVLLQAPGVAADSAIGGPNGFHVRNEYANVQYRINGVVLPEGVGGLGPVLDTSFVARLSLLTGALPAEYGLRTAGVIDITSRTFSENSGSLNAYGGSRETITPSVDYGGASGDAQYFFTARGNWNALGLENATQSFDAAHDQTEQGKYFAYLSTLLGDSSRLSFFSGAASSNFQIPNNPGQTPMDDFGPSVYPSAALNENEYDRYYFNVVALQTKAGDLDAQAALSQRHAHVHFVPDVFGDLVFNDVASNVTRDSDLYGGQVDASYRLSDEQKLRAGFSLTLERTHVTNMSAVLPVDPTTSAVAPTPFGITDYDAKTGWNIGGYLQHEWKLTDKLTLNTGARFDQLYQFVDANQLSPRFGLVLKPAQDTSFHAGWARYFTPPMQSEAATSNLALFTNTTDRPDVPFNNPVKPERADTVDVGLDQKLAPGLMVGLDAYAKVAWNQLDDGQFGQAYVLTQFNFARGYTKGIELKSAYQQDDFKAYGNFAVGTARSKDVITNEYLIDATTYVYLLDNYHNTDDSQFMTASAGASYKWDKTQFTTSMIYGSGLRSGFDNMDHVPAYFVVNLGTERELELVSGAKPLTARFDVTNVTDRKYELRSGTGIGVFAPQYGARRGFFVGLSQKL
jgi:outer membrane receptor protein involved in Fe transport